MTSLVIGASSVAQLEDNVAALDQPRPDRRRAGRDRPVRDGADINLWAESSAG